MPQRKRQWLWALLGGSLLLFGGLVNCGGSSGPADHQDPICMPGSVQSCTGPQGCSGQARCSGDGLRLGACSCGASTANGGSGMMDAGVSVALGGSGGSTAITPGGTGGGGGLAAVGGRGGASGSPQLVDGGSDAAACVDECDASAPTTCADGRITTCFLNPLSGCSVLYQFNCPLGTCGDENHCTECVNECAASGVTGCLKGAMGTCMVDQQGCFKWNATQTCAQGFCADDQGCGTCTQGCTTAGAVECTGGSSHVCVQDEFGCRDWTPLSECPTLQCQTATTCWQGYAAGQRGTPEDDEGTALAIDKRGAVATAGKYHSYGVTTYRQDSDAYLQVRDAQDKLLKDVVWGSDADDTATAVTADSQFTHLVVGWTVGQIGENPYYGGRDAFVIKWGDDTNKPIWLRQWGTDSNDIPRAVAVDSVDSVFVAGSTGGQLGTAQVGGDDLFVTKFDSAGNRLWTKQWGTNKADVITSATMGPGDHLWVAGRTGGKLGTDAKVGDYDAFVAELDSDGNMVQTRQFGTQYGDSAEGIAIDASGNVLVGGSTQGNMNGEQTSGGVDAFVVKFDGTLTAIWTKMWGTDHDDYGHALAISASGGPSLAVTVQSTDDPSCDPGKIAAVGWDTDGANSVNHLWDSCGAEGAAGVGVKPDGEVMILGWTAGPLVNEPRGGHDIISIQWQP